jgi:hypothetical protein
MIATTPRHANHYITTSIVCCLYHSSLACHTSKDDDERASILILGANTTTRTLTTPTTTMTMSECDDARRLLRVSQRARARERYELEHTALPRVGWMAIAWEWLLLLWLLLFVALGAELPIPAISCFGCNYRSLYPKPLYARVAVCVGV